MKSLNTYQKTVLCKLCCGSVPETDLNTINPFYHLHKIRVKQYRASKDKSPKSTVECSELTLDSDSARSFCPQHTIWQRITKMEGDNVVATYTATVYMVKKLGFE